MRDLYINIQVYKHFEGTSAARYVPDEGLSALVKEDALKMVRDPAVYQRAADLLEKGGHVKGTLAIDKDDEPISIVSEEAVCFCAVGAFMRAGWDLGYLRQDVPNDPGANSDVVPDIIALNFVGILTDAIGPKANDEYGYQSINFWNNKPYTTDEDVVAALRGASPERLD